MCEQDSGHGFTITRRFAAPVEVVWEAWTQAEHFERWFGARPGTASLDVRAGGRWQATVDMPDGAFALSGVYVDVVEHDLLIWTMDVPGEDVVMTANFFDVGDETVLVYNQSSGDAGAGATEILDSFEHYLEDLALRSRV